MGQNGLSVLAPETYLDSQLFYRDLGFRWKEASRGEPHGTYRLYRRTAAGDAECLLASPTFVGQS
jgi:hypothetical protein